MRGHLWTGLACVFAASSSLATTSHAQVSIEVVASSYRDGINVPNWHQHVGIAEDGMIVFGANTKAGTNRLLEARPGRIANELGINANAGGDVGINDTSIVFSFGSQVLAMGRTGRSPVVLLDCTSPATPCRGDRHLSLASDGSFAISSFDSLGGIYRGVVSKGAPRTALESVPVPTGLITAWGVDVGVGGPMLLRGDHSASSAEVYGAFGVTKSRIGSFQFTTEVSSRPRGGNEEPVSAVFGGGQVLALMPVQTDGQGTTLAPAALVRGAAAPYRTAQVQGTPLLQLDCIGSAQCPSVGSMDANDVGSAAIVARLVGGYAGLFTFDTTNPAASPVLLIRLDKQIASCRDYATALQVLGTNNAGQIVVLAEMQTDAGVDTQLWRVTPTPTQHTTTSYCH